MWRAEWESLVSDVVRRRVIRRWSTFSARPCVFWPGCVVDERVRTSSGRTAVCWPEHWVFACLMLLNKVGPEGGTHMQCWPVQSDQLTLSISLEEAHLVLSVVNTTVKSCFFRGEESCSTERKCGSTEDNFFLLLWGLMSFFDYWSPQCFAFFQINSKRRKAKTEKTMKNRSEAFFNFECRSVSSSINVGLNSSEKTKVLYFNRWLYFPDVCYKHS